MELRPCEEGNVYAGTVDLSTEELHELIGIFEDEDDPADWAQVEAVWKLLRTRVSDPLDATVLSDIKAFLDGKRDRRRLQQARNAVLTILSRCSPRRGRGRTIKMPMKQFLAEHEKLIHVLREGTPAERKAEADEQEKEMKGMGAGTELADSALILLLDVFAVAEFPRNTAEIKAMRDNILARVKSVPKEGFLSRRDKEAVTEAVIEYMAEQFTLLETLIQGRKRKEGEMGPSSPSATHREVARARERAKEVQERIRQMMDHKKTRLIKWHGDWITSKDKERRQAYIAEAQEIGRELSGKGRLPEQYSKPLRKLLEEVSFGPPDVVGSSGDPKAMYAADYDMLEYVPFRGKGTVKAFQKKVASLASKYCITDIKCGENPEWNLMAGKAYDRKKELAHLRQLWQDKVITDAELKEGESLLKEHLSKGEQLSVRKALRFGIWRWTPAEVAAGVKLDRLKKPIYLEEAMKSRGITKVDVLAWVRDRYVEVSNIVLWTARGGKPYAHIPTLLTALREDVLHYVHEGNFFKAAKRLLSIAKNKQQTETAEKLYAILNSHLGHISRVVSDLKTLAAFPNCVTDAKKREALDGLRDEMAKLYYPEFAKAKDPAKLLPALEEKLQEEARKELGKAGFLPLRGLYKEGEEEKG